jgi:hypothetical protein
MKGTMTVSRKRKTTSSSVSISSSTPSPPKLTVTPSVAAFKPDRKTWDYAARAQHAKVCAPMEDHFRELLKTKLTPLGFTVKAHEHALMRHDVVVSHDSSPGKTVLLELECGKDQAQWKDTIFDNEAKWKYGLNVLSRKVAEGKHFDLFIKYNVSGSSFFACSYEFIADKGIPQKLYRTSLAFNTDKTVFSIPWKVARECNDADEQFCMDNWEKLTLLIEESFRVKSLSPVKDHLQEPTPEQPIK